ncbi:MAG: response regulator [Candidatus Adiutrix sp.]|jgi:putative two-component system response regulator|nr:response regulator [Candidatus Adiutrix sp.]
MKTIFVVDDNDTNLVVARQALEGEYKTLTIPSAAKMFKLLEKIRPDLILLDIDMPEMDGFAAITELKKSDKFKDIPVIFLTASFDAALEIKGFELGAIDYVNKPFSAPVLRKRLETNIGIDALIKERTAEVESLRNGIISVLADMVEGRDLVTGGHIRRTQTYLKILLEAITQNNVYSELTRSWNLRIALPSAQLHDIGKITISDTILNKPGKLSDEEFEIIKTHSIEGEKLIDKIKSEVGQSADDFLRHSRLFAGTHHEKWNGGGYPRGLSGEDIPLEGRIMAVADVYDALTSERPYKQAFPHEEAVEIIKNDSGEVFDPLLAEVFLEVEDEFRVKSQAENP